MFGKSLIKTGRIPFLSQLFVALIILFALPLMIVTCNRSSISERVEFPKVWVGTWSTAPQLVEPRNIPPEPGLSNNTLRQIVCVSLGGDSLRMRFTNEFSKGPVTMQAVHVARSAGGSIIFPETDTALFFAGEPGITLAPETTVTCDPFYFVMEPRTHIAITIYFGKTAPDVTGHPGSRTTSYLLSGNQVSSVNFSGAVETAHWYTINSIDVMAPESAAAVAVLGNSITDGRGSGTDKQNRWPDELAIRLLMNPGTQHIAVLNMGIGGNCVLRGGLGPTAMERFDRDVLGQARVRWLIILEGINDIGGSRGAARTDTLAAELIAAFEQMIDKAHARDIKVYGATILPFARSFYDAEHRQKARDTVNEWIRSSNRFDAVIDFDITMRNPEDIMCLLPVGDTGDHLHPNEIGYQIMAKAIDLSLFE
jgi:lysophospholipase L1-like esterase